MSTDAMTLTRSSPWLARFYAWVQERFPPVQGVLILAMYLACALAGRAMALPAGQPLALGWRDLVGFLGLWSFFLMLRVFDEHKDYARDCENHPERVLQRGLITLDHLKLVGAAAIASQLGASLLLDGGLGAATTSWLIVMAWSALMAKEFFIGEWLERHLVLYALSHMAVMPMAVLWVMRMGAGSAPLSLEHAAPMLAVGFCAAAALEVTRKTRAPEEERPTVDSYAQTLGLDGALVAIMALVTASAGAQSWYVAQALAGPWWLHPLVWALPAVMLAALVAFRRAPTVAGRERNEAAVALDILGAYALIVVALAVTHPITLNTGAIS